MNAAEVTEIVATVIAEKLTIEEWKRAIMVLMKNLEEAAKTQGKEKEFSHLMGRVKRDFMIRVVKGKW